MLLLPRVRPTALLKLTAWAFHQHLINIMQDHEVDLESLRMLDAEDFAEIGVSASDIARLQLDLVQLDPSAPLPAVLDVPAVGTREQLKQQSEVRIFGKGDVRNGHTSSPPVLAPVASRPQQHADSALAFDTTGSELRTSAPVFEFRPAVSLQTDVSSPTSSSSPERSLNTAAAAFTPSFSSAPQVAAEEDNEEEEEADAEVE